MKYVQDIKAHLIERIKAENDAVRLREMQLLLDEIWSKHELKKLVRPIRKKLDLEQLKKEQNYKLDRQAFFKKIDELNVQEPIDELIKMI